MRCLSVLVLLVACSLPAPDRARSVDQQARSSVRLVTSCLASSGDLSLSGGSGVVVSRDRALTAGHVVACSGALGVAVVVGGATVPARVEVVDVPGDVVRVELGVAVESSDVEVGRRPRVGEQVCLVPSLPSPGRSCGEVKVSGDVLQHAAPTLRGNSGSGVYDSRGGLVGIVTRYMTCGGVPCGGEAAALWTRRWLVP